MRLYNNYVHASVTIKRDPALVEALQVLQSLHPTDVIIETGTYLGTGSTRMLANTFGSSVKRFVTMEASWVHWKVAFANLKQFPIVECLHGLSVNRAKALAFIKSDPAILNHRSYPDVFIDDVNDPIGFYTREIGGWVPQPGRLDSIKRTISSHFARSRERDELAGLLWAGDDLLTTTLGIHREHRPLIVLDSAGGVGNLEFLTVLDCMGKSGYALLCDDTHHLKHFRTLAHIRSSPDFKLVAVAADESWALAIHMGS